MKSPLFSIIIPIYKVEEYLEKCIRSAQSQTYSEIEIILVDDGSPDCCPLICDKFAQLDARIHVIHKSNGGLSDARNAGMRIAKGKYLMFLDADDFIAEDACEKLLPYTASEIDVIAFDGICLGISRQIVRPFDCSIIDGREFLKKSFQHNCLFVGAWLYIYRREFLESEGLTFRKGILHEDEHFTPRVLLAAKKVYNSHVDVYRYVVRDGSIMTSHNMQKNAQDLYTIGNELLRLYQEIDDKQLRKLLINSLSERYMELFNRGSLYKYGKTYEHKEYIWKNAKLPKTRIKALIYCISPYLYWYFHHIITSIKK